MDDEHIDLYSKIYSIKNLVQAWKEARKGKTQKNYAKDFEKNLRFNLKSLHEELENQTYKPKPLKTFILRDPKVRKISKSHFRDRIVHHALVRVIEPIFEKIFVYDCCANRKDRGSLFALNRFHKFLRKATKNGRINTFCLKADIKHYFQEVDHGILIDIIKRKIKDEKVIRLISRILENNVHDNPTGKGMPLGNLTSQFFANVYLHELDRFVKHGLRAKFYIRYVDDFILMNFSKEKLISWRGVINVFLLENLKIELHKQKTKIISLSRGIDFVGFRNFYHFRLLRKRNVRNMQRKIKLFNEGKTSYEKFFESFQGWNAYVKWANSHNLRKRIIKEISKTNPEKRKSLKNSF